jgi:hypothetical protein
VVPNNTTNIIRFGSNECGALDQIISLLAGPARDDNYPVMLDFNRLVPMPQCMVEEIELQSEFFARRISLEEYRRTEEKLKRKNVELFGFVYALEWTRHHWGTKWNAYGMGDQWIRGDKQDLEAESNHIYNPDGTPARMHWIQLQFETAWSFPDQIIRLLAKMADDHRCIFDHWFSDEGGDDTRYDPALDTMVMIWNHNVRSGFHWDGA